MWSTIEFCSLPAALLSYVNDLPSSTKIINPLKFAEDTNIFHEHKKRLFFHSKSRIKEYSQLVYVNHLCQTY